MLSISYISVLSFYVKLSYTFVLVKNSSGDVIFIGCFCVPKPSLKASAVPAWCAMYEVRRHWHSDRVTDWPALSVAGKASWQSELTSHEPLLSISVLKVGKRSLSEVWQSEEHFWHFMKVSALEVCGQAAHCSCLWCVCVCVRSGIGM